jgi:glutathione S-transferase
MQLYHFPSSPFARRVRLALALKGLTAELRDSRADPACRQESDRLNPMRTVPVLVDGERVITQSTAMLHYLDAKHPTPPLFPTGDALVSTVQWMADVDDMLATLVALSVRFSALHDAPKFPPVRAELGGRVQGTIDRLARSIASSRNWQAGEHAVFTFLAWMEGLPARAAQFPTAQKVLEVGIVLPPALIAWADQHRQRPEVLAL